MIVGIHVEQHHSKRDVARLHVVIHVTGVREGRRHLPVDHVPHRLREEHATHVAAPRSEVVPIEPIDGDLGGHVLARGHRCWAHNLMEG